MTESGKPADLSARFRRLIRRDGPISVAQYIGESNALYYAGRDPLGAAGDFTTAPEISQMFGEMVGIWFADVWARAGKPERAIYVELGPGRGTLAKDALRAMASLGLTPEVHLVEASAALRDVQAGALSQAHFHDSLETIPEGRPLLLAANEFMDALPIRQLVRTADGWRERMVALSGDEQGADEFVFAAGAAPMDAAVPTPLSEVPEGTVIETCPAAAAITAEIARRIDVEGGAALVIDYGHLVQRVGSTLQAVRRHEKVGVFEAPGDADLTAHVDFAALMDVAGRAGVAAATATQGEWLRAMGIDMRKDALIARNPDKSADITAAHARLTAPAEMGELFKVLALAARDWPRGAGFASSTGPQRISR